jgi:DNA-binding MarR family transcriptional regulator
MKASRMPTGVSTALERSHRGKNAPLALLHFAFRAIVAEPDARLEKLGLNRAHHRILFFIARSPGLRGVDLQHTLGVSKQAVHAPLQQLLKKKLVTSQAAKTNLRERKLALTAAGKALEQQLSGHQRRAFDTAFRKAGPRATRGWYAIMRQLALSLEPLLEGPRAAR